MNRHWNKTILPLFEKIKPKKIVEIGSDKGTNTKNILKFCEENNSKLISIDPKPNFDVDQLKKQYGEKFELYQDLSLRILPFLEDLDMILIDGDHNWYTVYNELKLIEKTCNDNYPIILFHDICWPYGRRDLYYNPDTIPKEYLLPYEEKGMIPNQKELSSNGLNDSGFKNALYEGGKQNGVLTAIEDYMAESKLDLLFYTIPAYYGLGILFLNDKKLQKIVENIIDYPQIMEELEKYYLKIIHSNIRVKISQLDQKNKKMDLELKKLTEKEHSLQEKNNEKEKEINTLKKEKTEENKTLKEKEQLITTMKKDIEKIKANLTEKEKQNKKLNEEITKINKTKQKEINALKKEKTEENKTLKEKELLITTMKKDIEKIKANLTEKEKQNKKLNEENNLNKKAIDEKNNQIETLNETIDVLNSIILEKDKTINLFNKS